MKPPAGSPPAADGYPLELDPRLVEDAVLLAIESAPAEERRRFRRERDPLYEITEREERESRFRELHDRWFVRLGLADPVRRALEREPTIAAGTSRCLVAPVVAARLEYADLKADRRAEEGSAEPRRREARPLLLLCLRVTTLVDRARLRPFLRRELLHVADMLDPEFGFDPEAPLGDDPALESLLRQRYQALWSASIDGRLAAREELPADVEKSRRTEFLGVFSMLGERGESCFERFFHGPRPSHAELAAFAADPGGLAERRPAGRCPLCRMPTAELHPSPGELGPATLAAIRNDFPEWRPERGVCLQCADLYAATPRPTSVRASRPA